MGGLSRKNGRNGQNGGCGVDGMMWNMVESSQQQDRFKRNVLLNSIVCPGAGYKLYFLEDKNCGKKIKKICRDNCISCDFRIDGGFYGIRKDQDGDIQA